MELATESNFGLGGDSMRVVAAENKRTREGGSVVVAVGVVDGFRGCVVVIVVVVVLVIVFVVFA